MSFMPGNHSHTVIQYNNLLAEVHRLEETQETPEDLQIQTTPGEIICNVVDNHHKDLQGDNRHKDLHGDNHLKDQDQPSGGSPLQVGPLGSTVE